MKNTPKKNTTKPLTEKRVREIVREEIALFYGKQQSFITQYLKGFIPK